MKALIREYIKKGLICSTAIAIVNNPGCVRLNKEQLTEISKAINE